MTANPLVMGGGDPGLFGPGSVTWRIHSHPCMLVGGLRGLLIQALEPLAMAGVDQHSEYRSDPWSRLVGTTNFLMATTFGDRAAAEAAFQRVRRIHDHVNGIDAITGQPYSANDSELLVWVHAAEADSFLAAYRAFGGAVSAADADRYVAETAVVPEGLGADPADVPRTFAEQQAYLDRHRMVVTPAAREAMRFVLYPPVPWFGGKVPAVPGGRLLLIPGRAGWSVYSLATISILPPRVRRLYGLPRVPLTPPLKAAVFALTRTMRALQTPPAIRAALERRRELETKAA